jgi:gluconate 2-dehydrogenase
MVPAKKETEKMIGKKEFKRMKKNAIFINPSRGKNVDEKALYHALKSKEILAAAIDVYETEPIQNDHPFLSLSNLITLPHIGAATFENERNMSETAARNLIAGLNGERPENLINPEVYYSAKYY